MSSPTHTLTYSHIHKHSQHLHPHTHSHTHLPTHLVPAGCMFPFYMCRTDSCLNSYTHPRLEHEDIMYSYKYHDYYMAVFLYCCPDCQSCLSHLNSIGWVTQAIWAAIKIYSFAKPIPSSYSLMHKCAWTKYFPSNYSERLKYHYLIYVYLYLYEYIIGSISGIKAKRERRLVIKLS